MIAAIRQALEVLSEPGQVIELRIPRPRHTRSGYFDKLDRAAEAAAKLNGTARRSRSSVLGLEGML